MLHRLGAGLALQLLAVGVASAANQSIPELASEKPQLATLVQLLKDTDLVTPLSDKNSTFTVFAPINDAFDGLKSKYSSKYNKNLYDFITAPAQKEALKKVLMYHVHSADPALLSANITESTVITTLAGENETLTVTVTGGEITLGPQRVKIETPDLHASNGVVHVITGILVPPSLRGIVAEFNDSPPAPVVPVPTPETPTICTAYRNLVEQIARSDTLPKLNNDSAACEASDVPDVSLFNSSLAVFGCGKSETNMTYAPVTPADKPTKAPTAANATKAPTVAGATKAPTKGTAPPSWWPSNAVPASGCPRVNAAIRSFQAMYADARATQGFRGKKTETRYVSLSLSLPVNLTDESQKADITSAVWNIVKTSDAAALVDVSDIKYFRSVDFAQCTATPTGAPTAAPKEPTIADLAQGPGFSYLLAALTKAGLAKDFGKPSPDGAYTVFAPVDAAFSGAAVMYDPVRKMNLLDFLLDPKQVEPLKTLLKYHVYSGATSILSSNITESRNITTLGGEKLEIKVAGNVITLGSTDARVITPDVSASNGIVHVIDGVLVPPSLLKVVEAFNATPPTPAPTNATASPTADPNATASPTKTPSYAANSCGRLMIELKIMSDDMMKEATIEKVLTDGLKKSTCIGVLGCLAEDGLVSSSGVDPSGGGGGGGGGDEKKKSNKTTIIIIAASVGFIVILAIVGVVIAKRRNQFQSTTDRNSGIDL